MYIVLPDLARRRRRWWWWRACMGGYRFEMVSLKISDCSLVTIIITIFVHNKIAPHSTDRVHFARLYMIAVRALSLSISFSLRAYCIVLHCVFGTRQATATRSTANYIFHTNTFSAHELDEQTTYRTTMTTNKNEYKKTHAHTHIKVEKKNEKQNAEIQMCV